MATTQQLLSRWYYCGASADSGRVVIVDSDGFTVLEGKVIDGGKSAALRLALRIVRDHNQARLQRKAKEKAIDDG